jgi:hypothetical protein
MIFTRKVITMVFCISNLFSLEKPTVRSFDVFDTIVGRLYYTSDSIFDLVEQNYPFKNFKTFRKEAERLSNGTLADTYIHLQNLLKLDEQTRERLKSFEIQTDINHIFPILYNLNMIEDGDILVSDTYYEPRDVERILKKVGLKKRVHLFVSTNGKKSGDIWSEIKSQYNISHHLGDNLSSDFYSPRKHGIESSLYNSELSPLERSIYNAGYTSLASCMRAARLLSPYEIGSANSMFWLEQSQLNLPILVLASQFIDQIAVDKGYNNFLFCARDCFHWIKIFKKMFPQYNANYFYSSRLAYKNPSKDYINYVQRLYTPQTLIIDGQGTGKTCKEFFHKYMLSQPNYLPLVGADFSNPQLGLSNNHSDKIELINYANHGSLETFINGNPVFLPIEYDYSIIRPSEECVEKICEYLPYFSFEKPNHQLLNSLLSILDQHTPIVSYFFNHVVDHSNQNR